MPNPSYSQNYYNNINNNMKSGMNYSQMRNVSNLSGSYYTGYSGNNNNYKNNDNFEQSMKNNSMGPGYQDPNKPKFVSFQVQKNDMNK
jgi:hypothetical protein